MNIIETKSHIGIRILAGFIDYSIISLLFFIYLYFFCEPNVDGKIFLNEISALVFIMLWGIFTIGVEISLGETLGNDIVGLKAIPESGVIRKLNFNESLKRHLLDFIDMPFLGLVGILFIMNSENNKRLGDFWANTIVIAKKEQKKMDY